MLSLDAGTLSLIVLAVTSCIVPRRELSLIYLARLIPLLLRHQLIKPAVLSACRAVSSISTNVRFFPVSS